MTGAIFLLLATVAAIALAYAYSSRASDLRSQASDRLHQREALLQKLQRIRLTAHVNGWSEKAWELVRAAAAIGPSDDLRAESAASLAGIDAHEVATLCGVRRIGPGV